jgi:cystathionine beta-lyase
MFDLDKPFDRRGGDSLKWGRYRDSDVIAAWVADMDFPSPPAIMEALQQRLTEHPLMGYERPGKGVFEAVENYLSSFHSWQVEREAITFLPGLVPALNWCCGMAGEAGDEVLVPTPIYPPFLSAPGNQGRRCVRLPHHREGDGWRMSIERWEELVTPKSRALLFCSPHNPLGRWWTDQELSHIADFCQRHNLLLISDEIHCQLVLDEREYGFRSIATLNEWTRANTVTLLAPSKTYNIPGMACAFAVIEDPQLRRRFQQASAGCIPEITPLSYIACETAYRHGEPWRQEMLAILRRNRDLLRDAVAQWPGVIDNSLEATYLQWLDISGLGFDNAYAAFEAGGVGLSEGLPFGNGNYLRVNLATQLETMQEIIARMEKVIHSAPNFPG